MEGTEVNRSKKKSEMKMKNKTNKRVQNGERIVGLLALFTPLETVYDRLWPNETLQ